MRPLIKPLNGIPRWVLSTSAVIILALVGVVWSALEERVMSLETQRISIIRSEEQISFIRDAISRIEKSLSSLSVEVRHLRGSEEYPANR